VLHFAPEPPLTKVFRRAARTYATADLTGRGADLKLDIADMRSIEDGSFDLVVACDVLEHVPRDREAMGEVRRVLARGGCAIFTVPQCAAHATTFEPGAVNEPLDRERLFGQADHVRMYGLDFPSRLREAGFDVQVRSARDLPHDVVTRHVLVPPVPSAHPLATNDRSLFFARRDAVAD
jgi:SAM-dependent methyltransferase